MKIEVASLLGKGEIYLAPLYIRLTLHFQTL